jgi:hypothetical protein
MLHHLPTQSLKVLVGRLTVVGGHEFDVEGMPAAPWMQKDRNAGNARIARERLELMSRPALLCIGDHICSIGPISLIGPIGNKSHCDFSNNEDSLRQPKIYELSLSPFFRIAATRRMQFRE